MPPFHASEMERVFRRVVDVTFNSLSIDTDTSTSDTVLLLANGAAGPVERPSSRAALGRCAAPWSCSWPPTARAPPR